MDKYKGKLFSVLGDSISTLEGYSVPSDAVFYEGANKLYGDIYAPADTWWGQIINSLGGELLVNNSFSGSMVCKHPKYTYPSYASSDERTCALGKNGISPDVIMVFMGVNDWGCGVTPTPEDIKDKSDFVFSVSYDIMLKKLKHNYPEAKIWCFTLPISTQSVNKEFTFPYVYKKYHIDKYCQVIRTLSEKHGCVTVDWHDKNKPYDTIDGFHANKSGMKTLSSMAIKILKGKLSGH